MGSWGKVQMLAENGHWTDWTKPTKELPQGSVIRLLMKDGPLTRFDQDWLGHSVGMILKAFPANSSVQESMKDFEAVTTLRLSLPGTPDVNDRAWLQANAALIEKEFDELFGEGRREKEGISFRKRIPWKNGSEIETFHTFLTFWTEHDRKIPKPENCPCENWAVAEDMTVRLLSGHHPNCEKCTPVAVAAGSVRMINALVTAMEVWGKDEFGIHPDAFEAYERAKLVIGKPLKKKDAS